jgi:hypothetical protein
MSNNVLINGKPYENMGRKATGLKETKAAELLTLPSFYNEGFFVKNYCCKVFLSESCRLNVR